MDIALVIVNIVVLLIMVGILYRMQKKHISLTKRVFTGLGMGVAFGAILQVVYGSTSSVVTTSTDWFSIIGSGYVGFLKMIVTPLIMVSIVSAFTALIVLSAMNLPVGLAGLFISIEPLIDMGRTALNISGSMTAGTVSAKLLGELDTKVFLITRNA